ncbi:MAG: polysaccharide deacetylase family protein, partial [Ferrovum sp.]|nr:polysaccharide deacetylase family protein [Ferrovum sp.]
MARLNAMTIDVEDYFQVSAFAPYIRREDWPHLPCRIERNM